MGKKRTARVKSRSSYSRINFPIWFKRFKEITNALLSGKRVSGDNGKTWFTSMAEYHEFLVQYAYDGFRKSNSPHGEYDASMFVNMFLEAKVSKYDNIFITSENVIDFCKNQRFPEGQYDIIYESIKNNSNVHNNKDYFKEATEGSERLIAVHMPNVKDSILFSIVGGEYGKPRLYGLYDGYLMAFDFISDNDPKEKEPRDVFKFLLNIFLYIDAFPESIIDGAPPVVLDPHERTGHRKIIGECDTIRELYTHGMSPHLRRGHFRFLKSDRYKNKRYQTVYVKPTMVKGHASHVVEATA